MLMVLLLASVPTPEAAEVTVMTPPFDTDKLETILDAAEVPVVQPQSALSAAGRELPDWKTSVTEVRHCDAAKMTSDTLARTV